MSKKMIAIVALAALAATSAFAQIGIGWTGSLYTDSKLSGSEVIDQFQNGDGIFWGPMLELGMDSFAIGLAGNFSLYDYDYYGIGTMYPMVESDVNLYIQGHLFDYDAFLDPFVELGVGMMAFDFQNAEDDWNTDMPLYASKYLSAGAGFGLNFGSLGAFFKALYTFNMGEPEYTLYDAYDNPIGSTTIDRYPLRKFKVILGAKILF